MHLRAKTNRDLWVTFYVMIFRLVAGLLLLVIVHKILISFAVKQWGLLQSHKQYDLDCWLCRGLQMGFYLSPKNCLEVLKEEIETILFWL